MTFLRLAAPVLLVLAATGPIWKSVPARTSAITGTDPIAELIPAEIGRMTQWLRIRSADRGNPILLWLHGGPGSAQMPFHRVTGALEQDFVNVHWDQRGACNPKPRDFDPATRAVEQFLSDAREVTALLRDRVGDQRSSSWAIPGAGCSTPGSWPAGPIRPQIEPTLPHLHHDRDPGEAFGVRPDLEAHILMGHC